MGQQKTIVLIVVICILVVVVIMSITWNDTLKTPTVIPIPPGYDKSDLGLRCIMDTDSPPSVLSSIPEEFIPQKCKDGLQCQKYNSTDTYGVCLRELNTACKVLTECVSEANYCSGVCSLTSAGGINQVCSSTNKSCIAGKTTCVYEPQSSSGLCKSISTCSVDDDCASNFCNDGICKIKQVNGNVCGSNIDCESNVCMSQDGTHKYCQASSDIIKGGIDYTCMIYGSNSNGPRCDSSITGCAYTSILSGYGTCQLTSHKWPSNLCDENNACIEPTICLNGKCSFPSITNSCDAKNTTTICTTGYTCNSGICESSTIGVPSSSGSMGISKWLNGSGVGNWVNVGKTLTYVEEDNLKEMYSIDYKGGTAYILGGYANKTLNNGVATTVVQMFRTTPSFDKIDIKIQYSFTLNGALTVIDGVTLDFFRPMMDGNIFLFFFYTVSGLKYYRPYIYYPDNEFYTDVGTTVIKIDHPCYSQQATFPATGINIIPINKIFTVKYAGSTSIYDSPGKYNFVNAWADTRLSTSEPSVIITLDDTNSDSFAYIRTEINDINNLTFPNPEDNFLHITELTKALEGEVERLPYIYSKIPSPVKDDIETSTYTRKNLSVLGSRINIMDTISSTTKAITDTSIEPLNSYSLFYENGSTPEQIVLAYTKFSTEITELEYSTMGIISKLPGYFNSVTFVSVSCKYSGTDPTLKVSNWSPTVSVLTLTH
jgi:hypothetical protein